MAKKKYDLVVMAGSYVDRSGETKKRWKTIGAVMINDNGKPYVLLDRMINLAAIPVEDGRDNVMVNCLEPRDDQQRQPYAQEPAAPQASSTGESYPF